MGTVLFWLAAGVLVAAPFWAPAIVPAKLQRTRLVVCGLGALGCLTLLVFFGLSATHGIGRVTSGLGAVSPVLLINVLLSLSCIVGAAVLLWPTPRGASRKRA